MRKVILYIAMSLDGYIAKEDGDLSFLNTVADPPEDYGYETFLATIDTVIMGRKTNDKVLSFGIEFPHRDKRCFVISRSRRGKDENVEYYNGGVNELIKELKGAEGLDVFIDGGAELVFELMKQDLIDRYIISIIPVMLGGGIQLFKQGRPENKLRLDKSMSFRSGLVQLWFDRIST